MKKILLVLSCLTALMGCGKTETSVNKKYVKVDRYENVEYSFDYQLMCHISKWEYGEGTKEWVVYLTEFYVDEYNNSHTFYICTKHNNSKDYILIRGAL